MRAAIQGPRHLHWLGGFAVLCPALLTSQSWIAFCLACAFGTVFWVAASVPTGVERLSELPQRHRVLVAGIGAMPLVTVPYALKLTVDNDSFGEPCNALAIGTLVVTNVSLAALWSLAVTSKLTIWYTLRASLAVAAVLNGITVALLLQMPFEPTGHSWPYHCQKDVARSGGPVQKLTITMAIFAVLTCVSVPRRFKWLRDAWFFVRLADLRDQGNELGGGDRRPSCHWHADALQAVGSASMVSGSLRDKSGSTLQSMVDLRKARSWSPSASSSGSSGSRVLPPIEGRRAKWLRDFERSHAAGLGREFVAARRGGGVDDDDDDDDDDDYDHDGAAAGDGNDDEDRSDAAVCDERSEEEWTPMAYTHADYAGWGTAACAPPSMRSSTRQDAGARVSNSKRARMSPPRRAAS